MAHKRSVNAADTRYTKSLDLSVDDRQYSLRGFIKAISFAELQLDAGDYLSLVRLSGADLLQQRPHALSVN